MRLSIFKIISICELAAVNHCLKLIPVAVLLIQFHKSTPSSHSVHPLAAKTSLVQIMAQQIDMEGTSTSGEAQEFERVLTENGVAKDTIQKLASNGLKTMYIFPISLNVYL